jgi:hypothetical protein
MGGGVLLAEASVTSGIRQMAGRFSTAPRQQQIGID